MVCVGLPTRTRCSPSAWSPVGVTYWFGDKELQGIYPWAEEAFGDAELPELLRTPTASQLEKIAALQPDLIIGQYAGLKQAEYDKLSALAPTVAQTGDYVDFGTPWQDATVTIGTAIGKKAEAEALVAEVEQRIADEAAAHPEFQGQTAAVVTPYEGLFLYGPDDPRSRMLESLGFTLHPVITGADDSEFGVSLSAERTSDLGDIGVAVWLDLQSRRVGRVGLGGHPGGRRGPLLRHQRGGRRQLLRRAQLRDAAEHPLHARPLRPAARGRGRRRRGDRAAVVRHLSGQPRPPSLVLRRRAVRRTSSARAAGSAEPDS